MDRRTAARLIGARETEVVSVEDTPDGVLITVAAGTALLFAEKPDGAGRTGLMLARSPRPNWHGTFPVFTPHPDPDPDPDPEPVRVREPAATPDPETEPKPPKRRATKGETP